MRTPKPQGDFSVQLPSQRRACSHVVGKDDPAFRDGFAQIDKPRRLDCYLHHFSQSAKPFFSRFFNFFFSHSSPSKTSPSLLLSEKTIIVKAKNNPKKSKVINFQRAGLLYNQNDNLSILFVTKHAVVWVEKDENYVKSPLWGRKKGTPRRRSSAAAKRSTRCRFVLKRRVFH